MVTSVLPSISMDPVRRPIYVLGLCMYQRLTNIYVHVQNLHDVREIMPLQHDIYKETKKYVQITKAPTPGSTEDSVSYVAKGKKSF